jgi:hypothetical protein
MGVIPVDSNLQMSEEIATVLDFMIKEDRIQVPKLSLPQILLAKARPGLSAELIMSQITTIMEQDLGMTTGPLEGNTPNKLVQVIEATVKTLVDAIQEDMRVDIALDAGAIVSAAGGNAGGPVTVVGATTAPHTGVGIAR